MKLIEKFTDEQIHELAEEIGMGYSVCYVNRDTGEYIIMMDNQSLADYGIYWDEEEVVDDDTVYENVSGWQQEMYDDVKTDMKKIDSWEHVLHIKKLESFESFRIMENFVDEVIPEGKLKQNFWNALSKSHPFRNFNAIVHNCDYREDWFKYKQKALEEYVREVIGSVD